MMQRIGLTLIVVLGFFNLGPLPAARAEPMREFVMSCTYGALAGTLVGAATLAFSDRPGDNLNKVARGASLGLYGGILLGTYIVFGVPEGGEETAANHRLPPRQPPRLQVIPLISLNNGLEGASAQFTAYRF